MPGLQNVLTVGNQQYPLDQPEALGRFVQDLTKQPGGDVSSIQRSLLIEITYDLVSEGNSFADWQAVFKEIFIRNVGYQVEATMRSMLKINKDKDDTYAVAEKELYDLRCKLSSVKSAEVVDKVKQAELEKKIAELEPEVDEVGAGILRWGSNTFPIKAHFDKPLMQWWLGLRTEEPKTLNCWECVLFALVKTADLRIPKEYMVWCIEQVPIPNLVTNTAGVFSGARLYERTLPIMDYYFPRYDTQVLDANKERFRPLDDAAKCYQLPLDFKIPRGRLLIFDHMNHVGISTGKLYPITSKEAQLRWNRTLGHGILDLNGAGSTLRERTIEDIVSPDAGKNPGFCNNLLVVAPFPICNDTKTINMVWTIPPTTEEIEEYRLTLNAAATEAYNRRVAEIDADTTMSATKKQSALKQAKLKFETAVLNAVKKQDKKIFSITQVTPQPKRESFPLRYTPVDPYGGKVTF